jgi:general secretion pathway protein C
MKRLHLIISFILFIALCISLAYWAMQLFKPSARPIAAPPQTTQTAPKLDAAAALLGGHPNAVIASNYQLKGVVVDTNEVDSVAILVANGRAAHAYKINQEIAPGITVKEVQGQYVLLSENGVVKRVELPAKTKRK